MSVRVLSRALDAPDLNQGEKLVLVILADFADDAGRCWPSMETVARKANMTDRGARGIIRRLEEKGHVTTQFSKGRASNHYIVHPNTEQVSASNPEQDAGITRNDVPRNAPNPERNDTQPGTTVPPNRQEPSITDASASVESARACEVLPFSEPLRSAKPSRDPPKARIPEDAVPSNRDYAAAERRDVSREEADHEFERFKNYHLARDNRFKDWHRAWLTWLDSDFRKPRHGRSNPGDEARIRAAAEYARRHF